jgi:predicted ribosome-associated RNA-binding protein Tma20
MQDRWEYQIQQPSGDWITVNQSSRESQQSVGLKLNQMEKQYKGKRIRVLHNGILFDLR